MIIFHDLFSCSINTGDLFSSVFCFCKMKICSLFTLNKKKEKKKKIEILTTKCDEAKPDVAF